MATYKKRTAAPSKSDKNYIRYDRGGYNYCINISGGYVMPNCTGYAWGRWREILGKFHELSRGNAEVWWNKRSDGYERGQTPRVGAVICWSQGVVGNGADGAGHVAIVEEVKANGDIVTSNSAYKGTNFYMQTLKKPYIYKPGFKLQGFIYLPGNWEPDKPTPPTPKPDPKPEPTKFKAGDKVLVNGKLYTASNSSTTGKKVHSKASATVTRVVSGSKNPYYIGALQGWANNSNLTAVTPPKPTPPPSGDTDWVSEPGYEIVLKQSIWERNKPALNDGSGKVLRKKGDVIQVDAWKYADDLVWRRETNGKAIPTGPKGNGQAWATLRAISKPVPPKPTPPPVNPSTKYKEGDTVSVNGKLFKGSNSTETGKANHKNRVAKVTRVVAGTKNPYYIGDLQGWANDSNLKPAGSASKNKAIIQPGAKYVSKSSTNGKVVGKDYIGKEYDYEMNRVKDKPTWVYFPALKSYVDKSQVKFV